jgi:hypothetical protein
MPYSLNKVRNQNCYMVKNSYTNRIHAKCTSLDKAKKQLRLLNAIDHGWKPTKNFKSVKKSAKKSKKRSIKSKKSKRY